MGLYKHPFQGKSTYFNTVLEDLVLPKHFREQKCSSVQIEEVSYTESKQASQYQQKLKTQRNLQGGTENLT